MKLKCGDRRQTTWREGRWETRKWRRCRSGPAGRLHGLMSSLTEDGETKRKETY